MDYEAPRIVDLGSVAELTGQVNKVGPDADGLALPVLVVGSPVPLP